MAALSGASPKLVDEPNRQELRYISSGFVLKLNYRMTWYKIYHTKCDLTGHDDYIQGTPAGYTQGGFENHMPYDQAHSIHVDKFFKVDAAFTPID